MNPLVYFDKLLVNMNTLRMFSLEEINTIVKECPSNKACSYDGVFYEDIATNWDVSGEKVIDIYNTVLINLKTPSLWKMALIERIPKKNYCEADMTTLRDISLLPTIYKIFSKALCKRIVPYLEEKIPFWQRAYLCKRDRQELIFCLKTSIDDFKHLSSKFCITFIDRARFFGKFTYAEIGQTRIQYGLKCFFLFFLAGDSLLFPAFSHYVEDL